MWLWWRHWWALWLTFAVILVIVAASATLNAIAGKSEPNIQGLAGLRLDSFDNPVLVIGWCSGFGHPTRIHLWRYGVDPSRVFVQLSGNPEAAAGNYLEIPVAGPPPENAYTFTRGPLPLDDPEGTYEVAARGSEHRAEVVPLIFRLEDLAVLNDGRILRSSPSGVAAVEETTDDFRRATADYCASKGPDEPKEPEVDWIWIVLWGLR
jgi:hypothetical protein